MILFKSSAFYFLKLLIQFIIRDNNTFGMGVWYGTVVWDGIFVSYYIPNHRTIPGFTVCPLKESYVLRLITEPLQIKHDVVFCQFYYCSSVSGDDHMLR